MLARSVSTVDVAPPGKELDGDLPTSIAATDHAQPEPSSLSAVAAARVRRARTRDRLTPAPGSGALSPSIRPTSGRLIADDLKSTSGRVLRATRGRSTYTRPVLQSGFPSPGDSRSVRDFAG